MTSLETIKQTAERLKTKDIQIAEQTKNILTNISDLHNYIKQGEERSNVLTQASVLLTAVADKSRKVAKEHFEKIITTALQFVTQSMDYSFVIEEKNSKSKAGYEFYIKSTVNGTECLQKPEYANGGGFVDIISTAARYAYLEIFSDPRIMNATLFYDEPGKMISSEMSIKFAEYLKFLGTQYHRQTIMITHNENIADIADKTFEVDKNYNGVSSVNVIDNTVPQSLFDEDILFS